MTAPSYATNLTTFYLEGSANAITALGTGGSFLGDPETDFFIQGTDCLSKGGWTNALKGFIVDNDGNANITVPADGAIIFFAKYDAQGSLDIQANGGFQCVHGNTDSAYDHLYMGGKDTIAFNSWVPYAINPGTATPDATTGGGASGTHRWVGILADLPTTSGPTKGNPLAMDSIRYGRCDIEYTLGDTGGGGPASFSGAEAVGNVVGTRWGLLELLDGAFQTQGFHSIGLSGTAVDFRDSNKVLFWRKQLSNLTNDAISTAFNRVEILNSGTICQWTNIIWQALGTRSKGTFVHTAGTCDLDTCQFIDWDTLTFLAAANVTDTTFLRCGPVTAPSSVMNGSKIIEPVCSADESGFVYDATVETDGKLDNMIFEIGSTAHHAIDFGTNVDASLNSITLRGCAFDGFGIVDNSDDSALRFLATTGALTVNLIDCTVDGLVPVPQGQTVVEVTGTPDTIDAAALDSSASITVPSDCTGILATWTFFDGGTSNDMDSLLVSSDGFTIFENLADVSNSGGCGCAFLAAPSVGSQTFYWTWSGTAMLYGGCIILTYVKGQHGSPILDSGTDVGESPGSRSVTVNSETTDLVIGHVSAYSANSALLLNGGATLIDNYDYNSFGNDLCRIGSDAGSTDVDSTGGDTDCLVAACIKSAASGDPQNFSIDSEAGMIITPIVDAIALRVHVVDFTSGLAIDDARVYLHEDGDIENVYFEDETNASGDVTDSIVYPGDTAVKGWVRQFDISGNDYHPRDISGTITDKGLDLTVQLERVT